MLSYCAFACSMPDMRASVAITMTGMGTGLTWGSTVIRWNGTGEGR